MRKAFGYLRVSTPGQVDGDGFPRQRENILRWASAHDVEIVAWFEEKGVSGTLLERPALSDMMVALMSDGITLVVVEKLDRIARDQIVQETIIQSLLKRDFELMSAAPGEENLCGDDPGRKLMRTIMGAIHEYDKQMLVLKMRAARDRNSKTLGRRVEGRKLFTDETVIARMKELQTQGLNYPAIARKLNAEKHKTQTGSKWFPASVSRTLARVKKEVQ